MHGRTEIRKTDAVHFSPPPFLPLPPTPRRPSAGPRPGQAAAWLALGLLAALAAAACSTERGERRRFMARVAPPQPVLSGSAVYGNGVVTVQSWLGPSVRLHPAGRRATDRPPPRAGEHTGDGAIGTPRPFSEGGNSYSREEIDEMYGRVDYQFMRPPRLALTFTITNTGTAPVTISIANVDSPLGNFAARPETFTLAPGEHGSPDPMLSPIEDNFELLDVTLTLKVGTARETHVVPLRPAPAAPGAAPAPGGTRPD